MIYAFLRDMFYLSLFVTQGKEPFPRTIIDTPELSKYIHNFGMETDVGLVAEYNNIPVGAIWARVLSAENRGYGYVSDDIPEFGMAVVPGYRNKGNWERVIGQFFNSVQTNGVQKQFH
jgi:hypothetical protein